MQKMFFAPLRKVEDADDGSIMVTGIASTETPDSTGETILAGAIKKALPAYRKFPAIREMHGLVAAGRAVEIDVDDDGVTHLTAHIVDPSAVAKVKAKVYGGFSVGGKVVKRDPKDRTIITEILLAEISLVDRPAHPQAEITMWKVDSGIGADRDAVESAHAALDVLDRAVRPDPSEVIMKALRMKDLEIDRLQKRIDELLAEPLPPKTAGAYGFTAVSKEQDAGGNGFHKAEPNENDLVAALSAMSPDDRAMLLTKAALQLPRSVTMVTAQQ